MAKKPTPKMTCRMCGRELWVPGDRLPTHVTLRKQRTCPYSGRPWPGAADPVPTTKAQFMEGGCAGR